MGRPQKATGDYFSPNCNHKKTMLILEDRYGNNVYAFWFKLLELLGSTPGHCLDLNDESNMEFLQTKTHLGGDFCDRILDLLAKLGAIDKVAWEHHHIWSQNFVDGIADAYKNRRVDIPQRPSFYDQKPTLAGVSTDDNLPMPEFLVQPTDGNPQSKLKETKLKESKVDNSREDNKADDFEEYLIQLKEEFKNIDIDSALEEFDLYNAEVREEPPKSRKLAFRTWLTNCRKFGKNLRDTGRKTTGGSKSKIAFGERYGHLIK